MHNAALMLVWDVCTLVLHAGLVESCMGENLMLGNPLAISGRVAVQLLTSLLVCPVGNSHLRWFVPAHVACRLLQMYSCLQRQTHTGALGWFVRSATLGQVSALWVLFVIPCLVVALLVYAVQNLFSLQHLSEFLETETSHG
jgi:hypothetical protein